MISAVHCISLPTSQLSAEEEGLYDPSAVLLWTNEDLEANLETDESKATKQAAIDEILENIEKLDSLSELEFGADVLCPSAWMNEELQTYNPINPTQSNTFVGQSPPNYSLFNSGAFTPPQTPPYENQQTIQSSPVQNVAANITACTPAQDLPYSIPYIVEIPEYATASQQPDVARELAFVEELVRKRADSFPSSPCPSTNSSACGGSSDSSSEDFEWSPSPKASQKANRKRSKPYSCNDDKRSRKKEQNKNAATRYRMKKKAEVAEIQSEESTLEQHKVGLETKIVDLEREIKVLKGLMRDFFKEKGLVRF